MSATIDTPNVVALSTALAEACVQVPVAQGPAALARELARTAPGLTFREVLARGGWYRLGGVVDAAGTAVADDLEHWAEAELAAHGDDMQALADDFCDRGLRATRLTGKTHYWVAGTGGGAADYLQVEIEELQEVVCHALFRQDALPGSIEELVDPREACGGTQTPLGVPFHALRRVVHVEDFLAKMRAQKPDPQPIHRFVEAWEKSSAGHAAQFSHHWVVAVREHLDRYRQPIYNATPVAAVNGQPPKFEIGFGARGLALHDALTRFDRQVGYPMAWFFHTLTTKSVPHAVAAAVVEDMQSGFGYLPERDVQVLKDWLHRPYGF
ncbi:MAG: hypothetical protein Q8O25_08790 [Sulfurisoma sp.]|nr:hypothetical protein [Sulfurisoma sp.]